MSLQMQLWSIFVHLKWQVPFSLTFHFTMNLDTCGLLMFPHKFVKFIKFLNRILHWQLYGDCPDLDNLSIIDSVFFNQLRACYIYFFLTSLCFHHHLRCRPWLAWTVLVMFMPSTFLILRFIINGGLFGFLLHWWWW